MSKYLLNFKYVNMEKALWHGPTLGTVLKTPPVHDPKGVSTETGTGAPNPFPEHNAETLDARVHSYAHREGVPRRFLSERDSTQGPTQTVGPGRPPPNYYTSNKDSITGTRPGIVSYTLAY